MRIVTGNLNYKLIKYLMFKYTDVEYITPNPDISMIIVWL